MWVMISKHTTHTVMVINMQHSPMLACPRAWQRRVCEHLMKHQNTKQTIIAEISINIPLAMEVGVKQLYLCSLFYKKIRHVSKSDLLIKKVSAQTFAHIFVIERANIWLIISQKCIYIFLFVNYKAKSLHNRKSEWQIVSYSFKFICELINQQKKNISYSADKVCDPGFFLYWK